MFFDKPKYQRNQGGPRAGGANGHGGHGAPKPKPKSPAVIVLTDEMVKAMFARTSIFLEDGAVPVEGQVIGWKRTDAGCLGAIVANPLTGARFLYGPDLAKGGRKPRLLARLA